MEAVRRLKYIRRGKTEEKGDANEVLTRGISERRYWEVANGYSYLHEIQVESNSTGFYIDKIFSF